MSKLILKQSALLALSAVLMYSAQSKAVVVAPELKSNKGMVAAAHPLAAAAGAEILEKGGNAIDAAIATSFALGVVEPYASSLFGEGYMVVRKADGTTFSIDFRSAAPAEATYFNLNARGLTTKTASKTPNGVCVPGVVAGIESIYAKGASKPLAELAAPAIRLAEEGFKVTPTFAQVTKDNFDNLVKNAPDFLNEELPWEPGDTFTNPKLGKTLRTLVEKGLREFYEGSIADDVERYMIEKGGLLRKSDLKAYKAIERTPLQGEYRGYRITIAGLPVGGPRLLEHLNLLENFNLKAMGWDDPVRLHLMQEIFLLAGEDMKAYIGDPAFGVTSETGMASKEYAKVRMMNIKLNGATTAEDVKNGKLKPGDAPLFEKGLKYTDYLTREKAAKLDRASGDGYESASTTHFSVIDQWGNAVAWTQTISSFYGTSHWVDGFFMNNELGNFNSKPNNTMGDLVPGRRPRTQIAPMVIEKDGQLKWVLGTPGAGRITTTLTQIIVDLVDFGMTLEQSIKAPKIMSTFSSKKGSFMEMEKGYSEKTVETLKKGLGYTVDVKSYPNLYFGGPNVIERSPDGTLTGIGSVRRGGSAAAPEL